MGIWRAFGPRPASVTRTDLYYGGPSYIAGYCPTGEDSLYAYIVEDGPGPLALCSARSSWRRCASSPQAYHGPWDDIRATLTDPSRVNYTWFETHVLPAPWNRGRVVLIGDAAHTCPPTLAQGAAQAAGGRRRPRRAAALRATPLDQPTCGTRSTPAASTAPTTVVDASNQLGQWLLDHVQGDVPGLLHSVTELVRQPA